MHTKGPKPCMDGGAKQLLKMFSFIISIALVCSSDAEEVQEKLQYTWMSFSASVVFCLFFLSQDFHFLLQDPRTPEGFQKGSLKGSLNCFRRVLEGFFGRVLS